MSEIATPGAEVREAETVWERASSTRWGRYLTDAEREALLFAVRAAGEPSVAVDHGCEGGRWSMLLHDIGWSLVCVDVNPETLAICGGRLPDAACVLAEPSQPTIPVASSAARLLVVFEVAPVSQRDWFPAEAARVLADGGVLACTYYNPTSARGVVYMLLRRVNELFSGRRRPRFHSHYYTGRSYLQFRRVVRRAGFEILREEGLGWFPFSRQSNSRLIPFFTRLEALLRLRQVPSLSPFVTLVAHRVRTD